MSSHVPTPRSVPRERRLLLFNNLLWHSANLGTCRWSPVMNFPSKPRAQITAVLQHSNWMYAYAFDCDPKNNSSCCSVMYRFHLETRIEETLEKPTMDTRNPGMVLLEGGIYVIGGYMYYPNSGITNRVFRYNIETDAWTEVASLNKARQGPGAASARGRIYVMGGSTTTCEYYDPGTNQWTCFLTPRDLPQTGFRRCFVRSGLVYVVNNTGKKLYCYDPEEEEWQDREISLTIPNTQMTVSSSDHVIFCFDEGEDIIYVLDRVSVVYSLHFQDDACTAKAVGKTEVPFSENTVFFVYYHRKVKREASQ